jgi:hypothetical protein
MPIWKIEFSPDGEGREYFEVAVIGDDVSEHGLQMVGSWLSEGEGDCQISLGDYSVYRL